MTWFDDLFAEYEAKHAVMFAFSDRQMEKKFAEWGEPYTTAGWTNAGSGLLIRVDVADEFIERMKTDSNAYRATLPAVVLECAGVDYWDRPRYRVISTEDATIARVGQIVVDVVMLPQGKAVEVHSITTEGEPIEALPVRVVYAEKIGEKL